jgi:hypothetical protein
LAGSVIGGIAETQEVVDYCTADGDDRRCGRASIDALSGDLEHDDPTQ